LAGIAAVTFVICCLPSSLWDGRWSVVLPATANGLILAWIILESRTIEPWVYLGYVLSMLMVVNSTSLALLVGAGILLSTAYGVPVYLLDHQQSEHVLLLPVLWAIVLVSTGKTNWIQAELRSRTATDERVRSEALSDTLTGLPNRAQFIERVWRAVHCSRNNSGVLFAVLFIDLDGFKPINDTLGHKAGDAVLKTVAKRLQACLRKGDLVGRYGGDEFTLLINNVAGKADAVRVAERVLRKLKEPIDVGQSVRVGASIGIALSTNIHSTPEDLIRHADAAMYRAKSLGKDRYEVSDQLGDTAEVDLGQKKRRRLLPQF
jgi:diguanylate cyclase (GGDEF)-like protein